jgi:FdhD protein
VRTRVQELTVAGARDHEDRLITEEPLEVRLAWPGTPAHRVWLTMRTPGHDFELVAGWLHHEGIGAPTAVAYCTDQDLRPDQEFNVVTATLGSLPDRLPATRDPALSAGSSACGVCGSDSIDAALEVVATERWTGELESDVVRALPARLRDQQSLFERTGGVHAAGLFDAAGTALVVREDVGRHNAVDKVTGARLLAGDSPAEAALAVSGRAGFELVQKALAAGVGALVAVGAPTSLALSLAQDAGLLLAGFTKARRCVVYAGADRVGV